MTQRQPSAEETANRVASLIAQALIELQQHSPAADGVEAARQDLVASRVALEQLAERLERQFADEREQRLLLAGQLSGLAGSLDRLVGHLQGLSELMTGLIEHASGTAPPAAATEEGEPAFRPGGEGVTLTLAAIPGFQALMDIQKALMALDSVAGASVDRFQEDDSRILLHLSGSVTASELASALKSATGHVLVIEESRPELLRLRLKVVATA